MIKYIHEKYFIRKVSDVLAEEGCEFSYDVTENRIYTRDGYDATELLLALFNHFDRLEIEKWREKFCETYGVPLSVLFPTEVHERKKYRFVHDKKMRVYISGPITGRKEEEYKSDFNNAELWLTGLGYDVVNPVSYGLIENGKWEDYMRRDIKLLCDCDYIYLLDGWQDSRGSRVEYGVACDLGIKILSFDINGKVV